jgi:hypothetical protein
MEDKTKKKRVQKRAVRKKVKPSEPVPVASIDAVTPTAPATEAKKPRKSSKPKSAANTRKQTPFSPTFEQVQLRAYFISERRRKLGLPGDESHDWMAAERELRQEISV